MSGKVVITNISADVKVDIRRDMRSPQFNKYKYCCICPELLGSAPVRYQKCHDIYSLGVLMWEIWTCMRVYEQDGTVPIYPTLNLGHMGSTPLDTSLGETEESKSDNLIDIDNLKSFITKMQPRRDPWFTADGSHASRAKWWSIIEDCLAMKASPNDLVKTMGFF